MLYNIWIEKVNNFFLTKTCEHQQTLFTNQLFLNLDIIAK